MRGRIALTTLLLVVPLWLGIAGYLLQKKRADLERTRQDSRNLAHAFEENIRRTVESIDTTIRALRVAYERNPPGFDLVAWDSGSGLPRELALQLSMSDRTGLVTASNLGSAKGASIADRPHFLAMRDTTDDRLFVSIPVVGRVSSQWSVQFVRRLTDRNGEFDGVIVASLDPKFLSRFSTSLDIGRGALLLFRRGGIVLSAAPTEAARLGADLTGTPLCPAESYGTAMMSGPGDAVSRIYSWRRVDPYGLFVAVGLSPDDALTGFHDDTTASVLLGAAATVLILAGNILLARHRRESRRSQQMLRAAVDNISQGLLVVDETRLVPVINARATELLQLPATLAHPGVEFDSILEFQLDRGDFTAAEPVRGLAESGGLAGGDTVYRRARTDGTVLEVRTRLLESGLAIRTFTDVTEQERSARVLADARDAAEAAAKARSEFLAVMSHEIRTPLNGVIGVAGVLEEMELGPAQRDYVRLIRQSGDHLLVLINDILDFSRLEAGRVELEQVDFSPASIVDTVVGIFTTQASAKGLALRQSVAAGVMDHVTGDPARLRQILLNLVSNAVKFTDQGSVLVSLRQEAESPERVRLHFSVTDTGIGICADGIDRMFQAFTQMDGSISRRFGGSGLGLAICRQLVGLMGGSLGVESREGAGTTFRFDVVLRQAKGNAAHETVPDQEPARQALSVLIAEDNPTNRLVAAQLLERLGHRADAVINGAEAVEAVNRRHYDIVLMDVMMPEMDGLTATRIIRAGGGAASRVAIVGLTAGSEPDNLAACIDAGMDAVTTKPITLARLKTAIAGGLDTASHRTVVAEEPDVSPLRELADTLGEDAVQEIVAAFAEDSAAHLRGMRSAAAAGDARTIFRSAHSLAGAARTVGAEAMAVRAKTLETSVGTMTASGIRETIEALQADLDAVLSDWRQAA